MAEHKSPSNRPQVTEELLLRPKYIKEAAVQVDKSRLPLPHIYLTDICSTNVSVSFATIKITPCRDCTEHLFQFKGEELSYS